MSLRALLVVALVVTPLGVAARGGGDVATSVRTSIAASVATRIGRAAHIDVEIVQSPSIAVEAVEASVLAGARFGTPARFLVTFADGRKSAVVARVDASARRAVAARNIDRDAPLADQDVEWIDGPLAGQAVAALPSAADMLGARVRRALVRGEVITAGVLQPAASVRAGDPVAVVIRRGPIEVRGEGRAVNSGAVGDTIRVLRPGSRQPLQGRLVEPAVVEISR